MKRDTTHTVLIILGAALIIALTGIILLAVSHTDAPGVLNDSVAYILIGMLGLLSTGPKQQVEVTNSAADPVPVARAEPVDGDENLP